MVFKLLTSFHLQSFFVVSKPRISLSYFALYFLRPKTRIIRELLSA